MKTIDQLGIHHPTPWHAKVRHSAREGLVYDNNDRPLFGVLLPSHAHLIAAAPDLYEALRECLEVLDEVEECFPDVDEETSKLTRKVKAALEKAGGDE